MTVTAALLRLRPGPNPDQVIGAPVAALQADRVFRRQYPQLVALSGVGSPLLVGYDRGDDGADVYRLSAAAPWVACAATLPVGTGWDLMESLVLGNQPHLLCYAAKNGMFAFFPVSDRLATTEPYRFYRTHEPGVTAGFTTVKPFTSQGRVVFLGYNGTSGHVAQYTLAVTASSPAGSPPLAAACAWSHQWAKGWTRFAFFQFGGENCFLKTNTWRPNVNIDHVLDNLAVGTVEVATRMDLQDAQELDLVEPFTLGHGDPYFVAYKKDGTTRCYRFHGDCRGWTAVAALTTVAGATHIVPVRLEDDLYLFVC